VSSSWTSPIQTALRGVNFLRSREHSPPRVALGTIAGGLLQLLRLRLRDSRSVDDAAADQFAEAMLRMLGLAEVEAAQIAARPPER
jgi:Tetracyclin repressor-like, C-terminal domain